MEVFIAVFLIALLLLSTMSYLTIAAVFFWTKSVMRQTVSVVVDSEPDEDPEENSTGAYL